MKKTLLIIFMLIFSGLIVTASTIEVPQDYETIQEAIDAALPGDIVYVNAGTYNEELYINKAITLEGADREDVIIDRIQIEATTADITSLTTEILELSEAPDCTIDDVALSELQIMESPGVTIQNSYFTSFEVGEGDALVIGYSPDCYIYNNEFTDYFVGVNIEDSDYTTMDSNTFTNCSFYAMEIGEGIYTVTNNAFYNCGISGDSFFATITMSGNTIDNYQLYYLENQNNLVFPSIDVGQIVLKNCYNILIRQTRMEHNTDNIIAIDSHDIYVQQCNLTGAKRGIYLAGVTDSSITESVLSYTTDSAIEGHNTDNILIEDVDIYGCYRSIYLNCDNTYQNNNIKSGPRDDDGNSFWNRNYYSDYTGVDLDGDGFGDTPHYIPGYIGNTDNEPRMEYYEWDSTPPVTDCIKGVYLRAQDDGIGLYTIYYRVYEKKVGWSEWMSSSEDIFVETENVIFIDYYAIDDLGNQGPNHTINVKS